MQSKFVLRFASQGMCSWKKGWHQHTCYTWLHYITALVDLPPQLILYTIHRCINTSLNFGPKTIPQYLHNASQDNTNHYIHHHCTCHTPFTVYIGESVTCTASMEQDEGIHSRWIYDAAVLETRPEWLDASISYIVAQLDQYHGKRWHREGNVFVHPIISKDI